MKLTDDDFHEFLLRHRSYGFGRMMHFISEMWRKSDPVGALSVGDAYGSLERKRNRCVAEGHDVWSGNSYDWCDRCGVRLDPDTGEAMP